MRTAAKLVGAALMLACVDAAPARDAASFLRQLHELDDLPRFDRRTSELAAGWDRLGGNDFDGSWHLLEVEGDHDVLLDVAGPGCIHRISTGDLDRVAGTRLELRLDHEAAPRLVMPVEDFFDPALSPFGAPLVDARSYPTVRMPIPFAEHAELRLVSESSVPQWGVFWQVGYSRYPADTPVESLVLPLDPATRRELDRVSEAWARTLAGGPRANDPASARLARTLAPGERASWSETDGGTIERLELRVNPNWPAAWRWLRLRVTWDDADQPAIDLPVAELFAGDYGDEPEAEFDSMLLGAREGRAYLRLPMPYHQGARVELINEGSLDLEVDLGLWRDPSEPPEDAGTLHARVESAPAATDSSPRSGPMNIPVHRLLDAKGRGKLVGVILRVDWPYETLWWGEGDWQIWVDQDLGDWPPTYHGTGTEEFFDGGWTRFDPKPLAGPIVQDQSRVSVFGFMLNDAVVWEQNIRVQVETMGLGFGNDVILAEHPTWSSTVLWYAYP